MRRRPQAKSDQPALKPPPVHEDPHTAKARGHSRSPVPSAGLLVVAFVLFHAAVVGTIGHFHTWLPTPLGLDAPPDQFSEARARAVLEKIMDFGYRPVGSEANDVLTPAYLLSEIEKIKSAAPVGVSIEVDVQKPTGAFGLKFLATFQNIYSNVTNIVVRLANTASEDEGVLKNSLMLSSHYDAAFGAAAASDDGVNIAIMMEVLRYFAMNPPTHGSLIFNFNGAEETILQAAHGFITQHKWTKNIRAFINLEAAGAGGRELLFQTSSDELALAYTEGAKYPHASIVGQEVFQTGVIPSDTDFRVYRDFGAIAGMDFAYIANGYVYHTMLDDMSRIQPGAVQRLGENVVGVVKRLVNVPGRLQKIASTPQSSNTLFFDVAGQFMVSMGRNTAFQICSGVVMFALAYLARSPVTIRERAGALFLMWQCIVAALVASLVTALVLTLFAPLSWYTQPFLGAVTFLAPALAAMCDRMASFLRRKMPQPQSNAKSVSETLWRVEESLFEAMLLTWLLILIALLSQNVISSYVMAMWVVFPLLGHHVRRMLHHLGCSAAIPVLHSGFILVLAFMFFIPLMGRAGTLVPPDAVVAVLFVLSLVVMLSYSSRFFCFVPPKTLESFRNVLVAVSVVAVVLSTLMNPYSEITPKRLMVQHVHREVRLPNGTVTTTDAGLWVNAVDFRGLSPIRPFLAKTPWKDASLTAPPKALVNKLGLYGDMPFSKPLRDFLPERHSWYLPAQAPVFAETERMSDLEVVSSSYDASTDRRTIHLLLTGPAHLGIFIDATATRLTSWSLSDGVSGPAPHKNGTYILQFATGAPPAAFHFWLEAATAAPIEVGVVGHHLHKQTQALSALREALPPWMNAVEFVSTWSTRWI